MSSAGIQLNELPDACGAASTRPSLREWRASKKAIDGRAGDSSDVSLARPNDSEQRATSKCATTPRATRIVAMPATVLACAIVAAIPLATDPFGFWMFSTVKQSVLLVGAALLLLALALRAVRFAWSSNPPRRSHVLVFAHPTCIADDATALFEKPTWRWLARPECLLVALAVALWLWSLLIAPRALNPALHLGFGWARLSAYSIFFLFALRCGRDARQPTVLLLGAVAVSALAMALYACVQAAGLDPLAWLVGTPIQQTGRWRIFTTTGNPDWTAEYLAAAVPIAVWWMRRLTRAAPLLWLLFAVAILPTGSRLGLAALGVGAAIDAGLRWKYRRRERSSRSGMAGFAICAVAASALAYGLRNWGFADTLTRWADMSSVFGRLHSWQASLHLIATRPLAGFGLDHFALALPDGLRAVAAPLDQTARSRLPALLAAHAHNDFLEFAVELGALGGLLLIALFGFGLHAAWRAHAAAGANVSDDRLKHHNALALSVVPAIAASLASLLLLALASAPLHTPATALLFWLDLGCLAGLTWATRSDSSRHPAAVSRTWLRVGSVAAMLLAMFVVAWAGQRGFAMVSENRQAANAAALQTAGQPRASEVEYRNAVARAPWDHVGGVALASLLLDDNRADAALRVLDRADAWSRSRESWLLRAHALLRKPDIAAALQVMQRATNAVPDFLRAEMLRGDLAMLLGRTDEAMAAYRQVLLSPQRSTRAKRIIAEATHRLALLPTHAPSMNPTSANEASHAPWLH